MPRKNIKPMFDEICTEYNNLKNRYKQIIGDYFDDDETWNWECDISSFFDFAPKANYIYITAKEVIIKIKDAKFKKDDKNDYTAESKEMSKKANNIKNDIKEKYKTTKPMFEYFSDAEQSFLNTLSIEKELDDY